MDYSIIKTIYKDGNIEETTKLNEKPTFEEALRYARDLAEYWNVFFYNSKLTKTESGAQLNHTNAKGTEHYSTIYEVIINY